MQINKIQGPSFGECHIHKSANRLFGEISCQTTSNLFRKAYDISNTKHWDMLITSNYTNDGYVTYFLNKTKPLEQSFMGDLIPFEKFRNKIFAIAPDANPYNEKNNIYHLEFETEERADEVYRFLNQTKPQKGEEIFDREFDIIHILEESYDYMSKPKAQKEEKVSLLGKIWGLFKNK